MIQISIHEFHNDLILPVSQGRFYVDWDEELRVCISDTSLRNYTSKHIKQMINRNRTKCGCETCTSAILLQSGLNWQNMKCCISMQHQQGF